MVKSPTYRVSLIIGLMPVWLLLGIALVQFYFAKTAGLSPWRAGGFGMFSSVGDVNTRYLRAYGLSGATEIPLDLTSLGSQHSYRFQVWPRDIYFQALGRQLSCDPQVKPYYSHIRIEYLTGTFDADASKFVVTKIREQSFSCQERP